MLPVYSTMGKRRCKNKRNGILPFELVYNIYTMHQNQDATHFKEMSLQVNQLIHLVRI